MALRRTFVGFRSSDVQRYRLMLAWKAHEHIDFDFCDCQLQNEIRSEDEDHIKWKCRQRIKMAGTYLLLIGKDTRYKYKYVRWEAEVALEKECRIIGVNLDHWWRSNPDTCPAVIRNIGATFVPFSPKIIAHALTNAKRHDLKNWIFKEAIYAKLGYTLNGNVATLTTLRKPFL